MSTPTDADIRSVANGKLSLFKKGAVLWGVVYYVLLFGVPIASVALTGIASFYNFNLNSPNLETSDASPIPLPIIVVSGLVSLLTLLEAGLRPLAKYTRVLLFCGAYQFFLDTFGNELAILENIVKDKGVGISEFVCNKWAIHKSAQLRAIEDAWIKESDPPEFIEFPLLDTLKQTGI